MDDVAFSPRATDYMDIALSPRSFNGSESAGKKFSPKIIIDNKQQLADATMQTEQNLDNMVQHELDKLRE